jgi:hypothetical protein
MLYKWCVFLSTRETGLVRLMKVTDECAQVYAFRRMNTDWIRLNGFKVKLDKIDMNDRYKVTQEQAIAILLKADWQEEEW